MARPQSNLARLTEALEAEILAAPEPEVSTIVAEAAAKPRLAALRALVAEAVAYGEENLAVPPDAHTVPLHLRRP